jgi:hypothetical protein
MRRLEGRVSALEQIKELKAKLAEMKAARKTKAKATSDMRAAGRYCS